MDQKTEPNLLIIRDIHEDLEKEIVLWAAILELQAGSPDLTLNHVAIQELLRTTPDREEITHDHY